MYLRILKKDIKRKKTMNVILLIFVMLAATFIASSANNLVTVNGALDNYFEKADIPDYWFASMSASDIERFEETAKDNGYDYRISQLIRIDPKNVLVEGKKFDYSNTLALSTLGGINIFDKNNEKITQINDGEIYVTNVIFQSTENDFHEGGKIIINQDGAKREFTIKGYTKDALFGSATVGMTRFLVSKNDAELFKDSGAAVCRAVEVHTNDAGYLDKFNKLGINAIMSIDRSMFKMMYIMDLLTAAILLVVSVVLILISMVILRFIINFTIAEEFREIGVMKAIGINALVAVFMVRSFITKEKSEIALLKAIGFKNAPLTLWQTLRIGIVLIVSVLAGALLSSPLSTLIITPIFRMMGAYSIDYEIRAAEVYILYPLIMLGVTASAAFISAQWLRRISSAQISNNE